MGKNLTESHRQAISEAKKGKDNGLKGRVMPEEHRKKISLSHMGKKMPRSGVEKHRKAMTGRASPKRKKVRCIDTGEVYDCAKIAAQQTGSSEKGIQRVCGSDPSRTRHNGFQWEYVE